MGELAWALYTTVAICLLVALYTGVQGPCSFHSPGTVMVVICEGLEDQKR